MRDKHPLDKVFKDDREIRRLKEKLPYLFKIAEIEVSKGGKTGMEVGTLRENIIIAYFMTVFGEEYIDTNIPINNSEIDFYLIYEDDKLPISVKTKTGKGLSGVKLVWTVDWD
ncbi:MAG: type II restriction endonuclease subunit R, partial [Aquificota bacterium]